MALPAPSLRGSLCELAALLRIWVLPRLFSCVLRPLLPLSLLSPLHPENLVRLPPACVFYLQTRDAWFGGMELRGRQRCPHPRLRALQFGFPRPGGPSTLRDAGIQLKGCFWPSSSPAQEPAACRGLQAPAPSPHPRCCLKAPVLPDPSPAQGRRRRKAAMGCCCSPHPHMGWQRPRGDSAQLLRPPFGSWKQAAVPQTLPAAAHPEGRRAMRQHEILQQGPTPALETGADTADRSHGRQAEKFKYF